MADFLESISQATCARFLEFLISDRNETSISVHDRLASLYLTMTLSAGKQKDESKHEFRDLNCLLIIAGMVQN